MKRIDTLDDDLSSITKKMESSIRNHLKGLDRYNQSDYQKQVEICQLGKLLAAYFPDFWIEEVREQPDFIISDGNKRVALEHQSILDIETKRTHGFFENLFHIAERDLQMDDSLPNFLVNCYLDKKNLSFKNSDKNRLIEIIKSTVTEFVLYGNVQENELIKRAIKMPHSQKNLCVNFGAYMVKDLDKETLTEFIDKKEKKLSSYKQNTDLKQWLLLVVSGVGEYSFDVDKPILGLDIDSGFDKIYLMLDFENILYELK